MENTAYKIRCYNVVAGSGAFSNPYDCLAVETGENEMTEKSSRLSLLMLLVVLRCRISHR